MPNVSFFLYCEEAIGRGEKLQINNPLNVILPEYVPGMFSFSIVCGIIGVDVDNNNHTMQVQFVNHEKTEVLINTGKFNLGEPSINDLHLPNELQGFTFNMDFRNVVFRHEGTYETIVTLNDKEVGRYPIHVKGRESLA